MTTSRTGTYAGLIRVSAMNGRQAGADDVHTDRDQTADIERGVPKGGRLHMLPPEFNVSGGLPLEKRPSLLAAIEGIERGEYAGLIVAYLSRLGRNLREQLRAWDRVEAAGGRIIVVREGIDTSTRAGRLQRNLLLSIAEDEREGHAERFDELKRWATEQGIWQKRQTPRGYSKGADRRLVPNADADQVRDAFVEFAEMGASIRSLGRTLGMTTAGVRALLRNRVYLGELHSGGYVNPSAHPPIVEAEVFEAAQLALDSRARPTRSGGPTALLAGLARCTGCGRVMSRSGHVYVCHRQFGNAGKCPAPVAITAANIDAHVALIARAELASLNVKGESGYSIERAREELQRAEAELGAYLAAVSAADVGALAFAEGARVRREAVDEARAAFVAEQQIAPSYVHATGAGAWDGLDADERNQVLRGLLGCVLVAPAGRGYRGPIEHRVRVIRHGADVGLPAPGEIATVPFPKLDDPAVLRVPLSEHAAQGGRGTEQMAA